ncbi:MAG: AAA family ATPase [Spirochaeta sp.]|jgi:chromosome partitioning protein|nr:AAA family ATPase [Spirochaeta sp.]
MKRIALAHLKGGVGKTTTAVNLAHLAAAAGIRTLLVDLDAQAAASYILRIDPHDAAKAKTVANATQGSTDHIFPSDAPLLDVLPGSLSYRKLPHLLSEQKPGKDPIQEIFKRVGKGYDLLVVDAPAGLHLESEAILRAVDLVLVPIVPSPLSMESFTKLTHFLEERAASGGRTASSGRKASDGQKAEKRPVVRGFFSMVDRRRKLHRDTVAAPHPATLWDVEIPAAAVVERMTTERVAITGVKRPGRVMPAYRELFDRVVRQLDLSIPANPE